MNIIEVIDKMKRMDKIKKVAIAACALFIAGSVAAGDVSAATLTDQQRIMRLERLLDSDLLRQQAQTIQSLREELSAIREIVEQQDFALDNMKQRQRNLYRDMDRRIANVEAGGRSNARAAAPVPPPSAGSATLTSPATTAVDKDGKLAYSAAFSLLKEGRYQQSIAAFESFKVSYPDSKYADNAQYWLAEAYYVSREYKKALIAFQQLIALYPESSKISGSRLKIGYVYFELKNWSAARDALQQVITLHPDTTMAKKASERMQRITREGN